MDALDMKMSEQSAYILFEALRIINKLKKLNEPEDNRLHYRLNYGNDVEIKRGKPGFM